ncbi:CDP-glucose 4,6-dehydratase [Sphingomonas sp.]|uniref:CDP-glucose 4,6-dehydratase n=1 Tax=Sphingomonas sp. TaxID=28214 RepID=UPI003B001752
MSAPDSAVQRGPAPAFWRGKRVFLTGHTGFKGSWLAIWLRSMGAIVKGFALPAEEPGLFHLADAGRGIESEHGDIRDADALRASLTAFGPEIVLHLAAQPLVRASYDDPVGTYAVNVMGTVHLLDAVRTCGGVQAAVIVTTDKCYANEGWVWGYRETDRLGGADPYSNSKAACELVVDAYRHSFFAPGAGTTIASARAGNVIGGGDFAADRLVPDAIRAFAAGTPLAVRNRLAVRPWQHVLEPLAGYLLLAERACADARFGQGWNFGPSVDENVTVGAVADRLATAWGDGARWAQDDGVHPHEAHTLKLDCARARQELGWRPRLDIDAALALTVAWYRAHHDGADMVRYTERQLADYVAAA